MITWQVCQENFQISSTTSSSRSNLKWQTWESFVSNNRKAILPIFKRTKAIMAGTEKLYPREPRGG